MILNKLTIVQRKERRMPKSTYYATALLPLAALVLCSAGCGKARQAEQTASSEPTQTKRVAVQSAPEQQHSNETPQRGDDMKVLVTVSIEHHAKEGKGPTDWDSFITWAEANNPESVETLRRLREAGVVFFCEQEAMKATVGQSKSIFAYYPSVPERGGIVALMIGSVMEMSAVNFAKMLEVQTKFDPDNVARKSM